MFFKKKNNTNQRFLKQVQHYPFELFDNLDSAGKVFLLLITKGLFIARGGEGKEKFYKGSQSQNHFSNIEEYRIPIKKNKNTQANDVDFQNAASKLLRSENNRTPGQIF